ncbi:N-acetyltransferase [Brevibacillus sp. Leaf182]|nr:N-acetyltransferase [Brevibacillus sp. Leaf182]
MHVCFVLLFGINFLSGVIKLSIEPLLLSFPESFETSRLHIRAPLAGDGQMVHLALTESIEDLCPWMPWAQSLPTEEKSEVNVRQARLKFLERSDLRLHLFDKHSGQLIGCSGLHQIDWDARKFEIGYWVRTSCRGQGYITEAVAGITSFAIRELQANRIVIRCDSRNIASSRVAERSGFILEGILRKDERSIDGTLRDTMVYAKVRGIDF